MHNYSGGGQLSILGIITILYVMFTRRNIIREALFEGQPTIAVQQGLRMGIIIFIVSEVMFIFCVFWGIFYFFFSSCI